MKIYFEDGTSWTEPHFPRSCYEEVLPGNYSETDWGQRRSPSEKALIASSINDIYKMVVEALKKEKEEKIRKHS